MQLVSAEDVHATFLSNYNECNIRYGDFKKQLAEDMASFVKPIREHAIELQKNEDGLRKILKAGAEKARESASKTITAARKAIGINYY
jgi:tryptophanyl-tRNA synthetase